MVALGVQDVISASHLLTDFSLFSVLTNEVAVTNAAGSLKADVPVGTSAFIPHAYTVHVSPPVQADIPNPSPSLLPFPFPTPTNSHTLSSFISAPVVVIDDHIALPLLTGLNPLRGPVSRPTAARFVPLSDAYARPLRLAAFRAAHDLGLERSALAEGTYAWVSGPTYETRGEATLLASAGATVVGMSTVPEVVAARDEGIRVLVLSLVTNMVVGVEQATRGRSVREELDTEVRDRKFCPQRITP
jgi:purine nucleoside phosphorylase